MDYSKITDKLYVGKLIRNRVDMDTLQLMGVTHILNSCQEHDYPHLIRNYEFVYLRNPELDDFKPKPVEWFRTAIEFYKQSKVLYCHCIEGINRSPSLAYAMLRSDGIPAEKAAHMIRSIRPQANMEYRWDAELAIRELGYGTGRTT